MTRRAKPAAKRRLWVPIALLIALAAIAVLALKPWGLLPSGTGTSGQVQSQRQQQASAAASAALHPYDVTPLLHPAKKYLGVALNGAPTSMAPVSTYAAKVGRTPDIVESYSSWGNDFNAQGAANVYAAGGLSYVSWEPKSPGLDKIADGSQDAYIKRFAAEVRNENVPIALSFGHEMNGSWYPWGTKTTTPATFVKAWQHIHDVFKAVGADNVIWVWSPNIVNPVPSVQLKPYWPGDAYVDWVGIVGYWALTGAHTFDTLYGPTRDEVRAFTDKPIIISETASEPGSRRATDVQLLFQGVKKYPDIIGLIWFDIPKRADWRIENTPVALAVFRREAASDAFGFEVPHQ